MGRRHRHRERVRRLRHAVQRHGEGGITIIDRGHDDAIATARRSLELEVRDVLDRAPLDPLRPRRYGPPIFLGLEDTDIRDRTGDVALSRFWYQGL